MRLCVFPRIQRGESIAAVEIRWQHPAFRHGFVGEMAMFRLGRAGHLRYDHRQRRRGDTFQKSLQETAPYPISLRQVIAR